MAPHAARSGPINHPVRAPQENHLGSAGRPLTAGLTAKRCAGGVEANTVTVAARRLSGIRFFWSIPSIPMLLSQSLWRRCRSFTRNSSSLPANISAESSAGGTVYNLGEVARRKRRTEWKRRQGVRHVRPNLSTSPLDLFILLYRGKRFSTI